MSVTPIPNDNAVFRSILDAWISDPSQAQFTNPSNNPYYGPISGWDTSNVTDMYRIFYGKTSFNDDISGWDTSNVTDMSYMFRSASASAFNQDISGWVTSNVTTMSYMFTGTQTFNQDIGGWNTTNVTNMNNMFNVALAFNQDISGWDTSNVINMQSMFRGTLVFNKDIGGWDTSNVKYMSGMFQSASAFNGDISGWDTSNVTYMGAMFQGAKVFNGDINYNSSTGAWDTSNVTDMSVMFDGAEAFNGDISGWNTSNVTTMSNMFNGASAFNQDIGGWNTTNVTNMNNMFRSASAFNKDISVWVVYEATNLDDMFATSGMEGNTYGLSTPTPVYTEFTAPSSTIDDTNFKNVVYNFFNSPTSGMFTNSSNIPYYGPISGWDTSSVTNMYRIFYGKTSFNEDISGWDTSNVTNMNNMFYSASAFNQDITTWNVSPTTDLTDMFNNSGMVGNTYGLTTPTPLYTEFTYIPPPVPDYLRMCFLEGTKIATEQGEVRVEHLRKGMKVETLGHGFVPVTHVGTRVIKHNAEEERVKDQLYVCPKSVFPDLHEDLVLTGCHSLFLIRDFKNEKEREKVSEVLGDIFVTDGNYRFPACVVEETQVYPIKGTFHVYHFSLEHEDPCMNYCIYANNLLVESASNRHMLTFDALTPIE